mgnify:CR=1 FL=1
MKKVLFPVSAFILSVATLFGQEDAPPSQKGEFIQMFFLFGLAIVFFYFIMWRPEQKRRKAQEEQRSQLKKGDRVLAMGIIGIVNSIKETTVILKMVDGSKIEVLKGAISEVMAPASGPEESE